MAYLLLKLVERRARRAGLPLRSPRALLRALEAPVRLARDGC